MAGRSSTLRSRDRAAQRDRLAPPATAELPCRRPAQLDLVVARPRPQHVDSGDDRDRLLVGRRRADGCGNRHVAEANPSPIRQPPVSWSPMSHTVSPPGVATPPAVLPQANDPCWCGSGRKYKRCHKRSEGRVLPGVREPDAHGAGAHPAAALRRHGRRGELGRTSGQVVRHARADARRRQAGRRDPAPRRRGRAPGHDHRRARRVRPRALHRARLLPVTAQLQRLSRRACARR